MSMFAVALLRTASLTFEIGLLALVRRCPQLLQRQGSSNASPSSTRHREFACSSLESSVAGFSTSSTTNLKRTVQFPFRSSVNLEGFAGFTLCLLRREPSVMAHHQSRSMPCSWQSASMFFAIDDSLTYFSWIRPGIGPASLSLFICHAAYRSSRLAASSTDSSLRQFRSL